MHHSQHRTRLLGKRLGIRTGRASSLAFIFQFALAIFLSQPAWAGDTDAELRAAQIGTWIVAPDSSDLTDANRYAVETFRPDGTVTSNFYSGPNCQGLRQSIEQHWSIKDGVEISIVDANGFAMHDRIVAHTEDRLTILSVDDGTTYTRVRAEPCGMPTS